MLARVIFIQLDNATPHRINPARFNQRCDEIGIDCRLVYQPSQSPDLNVCDLCFFPSLQSLYYKTSGIDNLHRLIAAVLDAFEQYDANKLNRAFLSLFMNYNQIKIHHGDNCYKLDHMGKQRLERIGMLPERIFVAQDIDEIPNDIFDGMMNGEGLHDEIEDNDFNMLFDDIDEQNL
jgi:hypothetical protein